MVHRKMDWKALGFATLALVFSFLFMFTLFFLGGCASGSAYHYKASGPGYEHRVDRVVDSRGNPVHHESVNMSPGAVPYGAYPGGWVGNPAAPAGYHHMPPPVYPDVQCVVTSAGQRICPSVDGVMPYTEQGDSPGLDSPNSRLHQHVHQIDDDVQVLSREVRDIDRYQRTDR